MSSIFVLHYCRSVQCSFSIFSFSFIASCSLEILCDDIVACVIFLWMGRTLITRILSSISVKSGGFSSHITSQIGIHKCKVSSTFKFYFALFSFRWSLPIMSRSTSQDCCTMVSMHLSWFLNEIWMMWYVEFVVLLVRFILVMVMKRTAVA